MGIEKKLWEAAIALFEGDEAAADHWLGQPLPVLGGKSPAKAPLEDVMDLIGRLEHGVFS